MRIFLLQAFTWNLSLSIRATKKHLYSEKGTPEVTDLIRQNYKDEAMVFCNCHRATWGA